MKKALVLIVMGCLAFNHVAQARRSPRLHHVRGYYRKDGTYVRPHMAGGGIGSHATLAPSTSSFDGESEPPTQEGVTEVIQEPTEPVQVQAAPPRIDDSESRRRREYQALVKEAQIRQQKFEAEQRAAAKAVRPTAVPPTPLPIATPVAVAPTVPTQQSSLPVPMLLMGGGILAVGALALWGYGKRR